MRYPCINHSNRPSVNKAALVAVVIAAVLMLSGISGKGQTRALQLSIKDSTGRQVGLYSESHALVIGISDYTAGWPRLESVPSEIDKVENALIKQGFRVTKVMNPDSNALFGAFEEFIDNYGYDEHNRLLFFFSGHGYTRKQGKKGYLVPADAPDPRDNEKGFLRKALGMGLILTWARQIEAKHAIFFFDSCFSGTVFKTKALPQAPPHISHVTSRPVRQFISAGSAGEEVPAQSVFTPLFVRAIEGRGDMDGDGYVTGTEIGLYLHREVLTYNTGQHPQYGKIRDPDLDEGDFVFKLARGDETIEPVARPTPASLSINSNIPEAEVFINGRRVGTTDLTDVDVSPGNYSVLVKKKGFAPYSRNVTVSEGQSLLLFVDLTQKAPSRSSEFLGQEIDRDGRFIAYDNGTVLDKSTRLMWASKDNGEPIDWLNAKRYCETYGGGGYDDWRMPTQEELSALYNKGKSYRASQRNCTVHLTGLIQLSACYTWASEANDDEAAYFGFSAGSRYSSFKSATYRYRALPVRESQ